MTIEGHPRFAAPPDPEGQARWKAQADAMRRERDEAAAASAPMRRRLLEAGPPLRDVDAAMACYDGCHPSVDVTDRCRGGTTCRCQWTEEEAAEAARGQERWWEEWRATVAARPRADDGQQAEADAVAERLGVHVVEIGGIFPFTIRASVDGRSFHLRDKHGMTLELAPEDEPDLFVSDELRWGVGEIEIADGDEGSMTGSWSKALTFAVTRVRDYLRQQGCDHTVDGRRPDPWHRFCSRCGSRLRDEVS